MIEKVTDNNTLLKVQRVESLNQSDLTDLCQATENAISDYKSSFNIGLKRSEPLIRTRLENYWKGVTLINERILFVGRIDGVIASSIQLIKPHPNNQTSSFACMVDQHFVSSWARYKGLSKMLLESAEQIAIEEGFKVVRTRLNSHLVDAINLYESMGYKKWGTLDKYEIIDGEMQSGYFYYKDL